MKKRYIVIIIILLVIAGSIFTGTKMIEASLNHLADLKITDIDFSKVDDGVYPGHCKVFPVEVDVEVTVKDHSITDIKIVKHINGKGQPAEAIIGKVIKAQSLDVDIVSGATYSSKAILKAIEDALKTK